MYIGKHTDASDTGLGLEGNKNVSAEQLTKVTPSPTAQLMGL